MSSPGGLLLFCTA